MQYEEVKAMCYRINELYNQHDLARCRPCTHQI